MLRCGSGSLCDAREALVRPVSWCPEVSCIASNLLLSRAALKGGPGPEWEVAGGPDLVGFSTLVWIAERSRVCRTVRWGKDMGVAMTRRHWN